VSVQINAFNFPVWGLLEKLAPAFLAGLPKIVKPAAQTAYLAEEVVRRIADLLPEGTLQLVCGAPDGLLEALGPQDHVGFTGSARTAAMLRKHPAVVTGGVRLGVEADSLNCSILGTDVSVDDPEFELFVRAVVTEMTVKSGQKCTAIRRVIVPSSLADSVTAAVGRLRSSCDALLHFESAADSKRSALMSPVLLRATPNSQARASDSSAGTSSSRRQAISITSPTRSSA
jgi:oxepin-CoA hydrolase/3-oxo-5,6-dehydrosuberyl-CoA semialdehyde dehydrogenase